jgi:tartronate-semialdehyde synthase
VVALSGDYDFQFMIEELAVGAQFNLPYIHVLVNNSYLGLIRQSSARLRDGLLRAARVRQHQRRIRVTRDGCRATGSTTSRWSKAWAARRFA